MQCNKFLFSSIFSLILIAVVSCSKTVNIEEISSFPKFREVLDEFADKKYSAPENKILDFSKKPDGYYVLVSDYEGENKEEHLFWSLKDNSFKDLSDHLPSGTTSNVGLKRFLNREYNFDRMVYYNYDEADEDIIKLLEGATNLTDTLNESLARAYSMRCSEISGPMEVGKKREKMSEKEAKEYVEFANKTIETYDQIIKSNPKYETIVGRVGTKRSNDCVHFWYELNVSGHNEFATDFLTKVNYDKLLLNFGKNTLSSCSKNAILFTSGDNDTFPLWYLQEKEGFRTDVSVINISLANVPYFNNYHIERENLKTTLDPEDYANEKIGFIYLNSYSDSPMEISTLLKQLKTDKIDDYVTESNGREMVSVPCSKLILPIDTTIIKDSSKILTGSFLISLSEPYLFLGEIFQLDIISSNNWERPVHYANTSIGLSKNFNFKEDRILTHKLVPYRTDAISNNLAQQYDLMMNQFNYSASYKDGYESNSIVLNYIYHFANLATKLANTNKTEKAKKILSKCEASFEFMEDEENTLIVTYLAGAWAKSGDKQKAQEYIDSALKTTEEELKTAEGLPGDLVRKLNEIAETCALYGLEGEERANELINKSSR